MKQVFPQIQGRAAPTLPSTGPCTIMDAHCSLCARGAKWIARNDACNEFTIIPMQSKLGTALLTHYGMDPNDPVSWLYLEDGQHYSSLQAVIKVGQRLGGIWNLLATLHILPVSLQNLLYGAVARNRYKIFGRTNLCETTDPKVKQRLYIDD